MKRFSDIDIDKHFFFINIEYIKLDSTTAKPLDGSGIKIFDPSTALDGEHLNMKHISEEWAEALTVTDMSTLTVKQMLFVRNNFVLGYVSMLEATLKIVDINDNKERTHAYANHVKDVDKWITELKIGTPK